MSGGDRGGGSNLSRAGSQAGPDSLLKWLVRAAAAIKKAFGRAEEWAVGGALNVNCARVEGGKRRR